MQVQIVLLITMFCMIFGCVLTNGYEALRERHQRRVLNRTGELLIRLYP